MYDIGRTNQFCWLVSTGPGGKRKNESLSNLGIEPLTLPSTIPRTALITGGAKRIGKSIAMALAREGCAIAIQYYHDKQAADATIAELPTHSVALQADLSDESATQQLIAQAADQLGPIGILINNASTFERDEWDTATRADWDQHLEPNLRAPFVLTQQFARQLPAGAEGCVINMIDQRVWSLTPHFVTYTLSKAGLWTLTQTMALALAPRIRVNAIGPGPTLPSPRQTQAQFERQYQSVPLRRPSDPEEMGRAVLAILALPSLTGQMLALDGGQHLQWAPTPPGAEPQE
jgi:NAD(P)-dependent dehydrogenase (short-subunit alcohol dehydrogenase family)